MCAHVVMAGSQPSSFPIDVGVKHGCVLAQVIFNLFLVAITLVSQRDLQPSHSAGAEYCLDGGFFNLRRIQSKIKSSAELTFGHQCADDAAFPNFSADGLQRSLDIMSETYIHAGLIVNTT